MTDRLPPHDDPWWTEAPIEDVLAPLTHERMPVKIWSHLSNMAAEEGRAAYTTMLRPPRKRPRLTAEKRAQIIEAVKTGRLYRQIATEIGVGESSVQRIAGEEGIGRGQGYQGTDTGTCDRCDGPLGMQNKSGTCRRCQRGKRR